MKTFDTSGKIVEAVPAGRLASFTLPTKKGATSERATLIQYFHENLRNIGGKQYSVKMVAIKLAHLKLPDLYYLKSMFFDILKIKGTDSAQKFFWWSIRGKK